MRLDAELVERDVFAAVALVRAVLAPFRDKSLKLME
jgi:hypothetical protein